MTHAAYVFDAYGTLFDVHAAVRRHASVIGPQGPALSQLWRAKQLEYSWVRSLMGAYRDFWQLTEEALDFALAAMPDVDRYPEVPGVLKALKARGAKVAILSNGSPAMLESAVRNAALDEIIDDIFSVDALRVFKTAPEVYDLVTTSYRAYPEAISFQSSNRWDIAGAAKFGFRPVWINRKQMPDEYQDLAPSLILPSLSGL